MSRIATSLRAVIGLAWTQLVHYRLPSLLAVLGIAVAVLLMVLLSGMGYGVTQAGTEGLAWLELDLWISGGPLAIDPGTLGGVRNPLLGAHETAADIAGREDVRSAGAMGFQAVYISTNGSEFHSVVGVGVAGDTSGINIVEGEGIPPGDVHYANGSYDGPMTNEVIIDELVAARFNVSVGDTLYIGGTLSSARRHPYTVVGVSRTFSTFLGTATVTLPLAELQTLTGTTGADPASLLTVTVAPGADVDAVEADLERTYPSYAVRTNREQLGAVLGRQSSVLASAGALVGIAIVVGTVLVVNVLGLLVYHQREELVALKAAGVSTGTLVGIVGGQAIAIGGLGGTVGLLAAPVVTAGLNPIIESLSGFAALIKLPWWILAGGGGLAVSIGLVGAIVAGWRIAGLDPREELRR